MIMYTMGEPEAHFLYSWLKKKKKINMFKHLCLNKNLRNKNNIVIYFFFKILKFVQARNSEIFTDKLK